MTLDQHIAELCAELDHCILTKSQRASMRSELEAALREQAQMLADESSGWSADEPDRAAA